MHWIHFDRQSSYPSPCDKPRALRIDSSQHTISSLRNLSSALNDVRHFRFRSSFVILTSIRNIHNRMQHNVQAQCVQFFWEVSTGCWERDTLFKLNKARVERSLYMLQGFVELHLRGSLVSPWPAILSTPPLEIFALGSDSGRLLGDAIRMCIRGRYRSRQTCQRK